MQATRRSTRTSDSCVQVASVSLLRRGSVPKRIEHLKILVTFDDSASALIALSFAHFNQTSSSTWNNRLGLLLQIGKASLNHTLTLLK